MATPISADFGYYPRPLAFSAGPVAVSTKPDLDEIVAEISTSEGAEEGWIYPGFQRVRDFSGNVRDRPYAARIFGLPNTHSIQHAAADSKAHLDFHVWALSFFTGMRLTTTEAGFVDGTPIKPGTLVDFTPLGTSLEAAVGLAEAFWTANRSEPAHAKRWVAAVHALFLSQYRHSLQFERILYSYTAIDACFALAKELHPGSPPGHTDRIEWMCGLFGMPTPAWAQRPAPKGSTQIATIRNALMHEALFMDEPLGFALHGVGTNQNLPLEMANLICRFLVALIGAPGADYVRSPITSRQTQGLRL